jgi:hypothetical protein
MHGYRAQAIGTSDGRLVLPQRQEPTGVSIFDYLFAFTGARSMLFAIPAQTILAGEYAPAPC